MSLELRELRSIKSSMSTIASCLDELCKDHKLATESEKCEEDCKLSKGRTIYSFAEAIPHFLKGARISFADSGEYFELVGKDMIKDGKYTCEGFTTRSILNDKFYVDYE